MGNSVFTIVFSGVGGQGLISSLQVLGDALIAKGFNVHSSETHGLGQRGGKVKTFLRFGPNETAPLPTLGTADIIVATEKSAVLDVLNFAHPNKETKFIIDPYKNEIVGTTYPPDNYIKELVEQKSNHIHYVPATELAEQKIGNTRTANTILIGYILKFLPIVAEDVIKSLESNFSKKILDVNQRALDLGKKYQ